jgi:hypothetical protein
VKTWEDELAEVRGVVDNLASAVPPLAEAAAPLLAWLEARAAERERVALWEALDLFTLVLHSWTKVKPERLENATFALEHHLRKMGL